MGVVDKGEAIEGDRRDHQILLNYYCNRVRQQGKCASKRKEVEKRVVDRYSVIKCSTINKIVLFLF